MMRQTLYHVTPSRNIQSIAELGVSGKFALGRLSGTYWVTETQVLWAVFHVSARHSMSTDRLVLYTAWIPEGDLIRTARRGVFRVTTTIFPNDVWPISRLAGKDEI